MAEYGGRNMRIMMSVGGSHDSWGDHDRSFEMKMAALGKIITILKGSED